MENSNTLPTIELNDIVVFRTDLVFGKEYGNLTYLSIPLVKKRGMVDTVSANGNFRVVGNGYWFTPEMVAQVIKPTKERVYTEQEMRTAIELARDFKRLEYPFPDYEYGYTPDKIIESLNK